MIPLPQSITSIWPLPFGLLLEQAAEGDFPRNIHFSSSIFSSGSCDTLHPRREIGHSPQSNFSCMSPFDNVLKGDTTLSSSHLILKDPMEDPQVCQCLSFVNHFFIFWIFKICVVNFSS